MSKRSLRLNGTKDGQFDEMAPENGAGDATSPALRLHPAYVDQLSASVQRKREALALAARTTIPSVARTIERMKACPDGIDPKLALRTADLLRAALAAMQEALVLEGVEDRDGLNRLKDETQTLQLQLADAVEQILCQKKG